MTDQSAFVTTDPSQPAQQPTTPANPFADQLAGIKNEDGAQKYDTLEKALDGLANAQSYIPQLKTDLSTKEAELVQLKAELANRQSVEDVVSRLQTPQSAPVAPEPTAPAAPQSITQEDVNTLVQQALTQNQQQTTAQSNKVKVNDALVKLYGDAANSVVIEKAKALNTTPQALEQLSSQSPDMVMALFNTPPSSVSPTTGSISIPPIVPQGEPLKAPEKSLLSGSTSVEQRDFFNKVQADVYAKLGVTQ